MTRLDAEVIQAPLMCYSRVTGDEGPCHVERRGDSSSKAGCEASCDCICGGELYPGGLCAFSATLPQEGRSRRLQQRPALRDPPSLLPSICNTALPRASCLAFMLLHGPQQGKHLYQPPCLLCCFTATPRASTCTDTSNPCHACSTCLRLHNLKCNSIHLPSSCIELRRRTGLGPHSCQQRTIRARAFLPRM